MFKMHKKYRSLSGLIRLNNTVLEEIYRNYENTKLQKQFKALRKKVGEMLRRISNAKREKTVPSMLMAALQKYDR